MLKVAGTGAHTIHCDRQLLGDKNGEQKIISAQPLRSATCKMHFNLRPRELADFDPLAVVTSLVNCVPAFKSHQSSLYIIIAELYMNALDHGVLKMDGSLKQSEGFFRYYVERKERLVNLTEGWINAVKAVYRW